MRGVDTLKQVESFQHPMHEPQDSERYLYRAGAHKPQPYFSHQPPPLGRLLIVIHDVLLSCTKRLTQNAQTVAVVRN